MVEDHDLVMVAIARQAREAAREAAAASAAKAPVTKAPAKATQNGEEASTLASLWEAFTAVLKGRSRFADEKSVVVASIERPGRKF